MSEPRFTPGPWRWGYRSEEFASDYYLLGPNGEQIHSDGSACGEYSPDIDVNGPDAHLIAAAPDLYGQLCEVYAAWEDGDPDADWWYAKLESIAAALAKARGEATQ